MMNIHFDKRGQGDLYHLLLLEELVHSILGTFFTHQFYNRGRQKTPFRTNMQENYLNLRGVFGRAKGVF